MALKRLITSAAALAMFGCSDGTSAPPTSFAGFGRPGTEAPQQEPNVNAAPSSGGAGAEDPGGPRSEGQGSGNVSFEGTQPTSSGNAASGSGAPQGEPVPVAEAPAAETPVAETPVPPAEMPTPPAEQPTEEPVPEEPAPIVRPALNCGAPPAALEGGVMGCDVNDSGNVAGQDWFLWYNGSGGGCMTAYDNLAGAFSAQWNNPGDFLARLGFWFDETETFAQMGEIGADYSFTKQGNAGGFNFIGIYGWTTGTLIEYYIVEDNFANGAVQPFGTQMRGSFTADGAQYNVYTGTRVNQPNITGGNADFTQVFSVRQNRRQCGHVSISEHFRQWQRLGINLGMAKESKIMVEAGGGNGSVTFTHANITITPPN
jgi:hypothetical protein